MREYFKVLSSIVISLLAIAIISSPISGLCAFVFAESEIFSYFVIPFVIAWFGFVLFGLIGAALWVVFFKALKLKSFNVMQKQSICAFLSMLCILSVAAIVLGVVLSHRGLYYFLLPYLFIAPVLPVILGSLFVYKRLYFNCED